MYWVFYEPEETGAYLFGDIIVMTDNIDDHDMAAVIIHVDEYGTVRVVKDGNGYHEDWR